MYLPNFAAKNPKREVDKHVPPGENIRETKSSLENLLQSQAASLKTPYLFLFFNKKIKILHDFL